MNWIKEASCRGTDTSIFYEKPTRKVVALCSGCPVKEQCYEYALYNESYGYFGGASESERRNIRAALGIPEPDPDVALKDKQMRRKKELDIDTIPHGTERGYNQERRGGWEPCEECRNAHRDYIRSFRANKKEVA